jgi:tetratricopeptide (TPR) repeat protein
MNTAQAILPLATLAFLTACAEPHYVDQAQGDSGLSLGPDVTFHVFDAFKASPPDCIAILPLTVKMPSQPQATADDAAKVRLSLYAHLSTQSKRGVALERIDHVLAEVKGDHKALANRIKCPVLIEGEVTEYGSGFYGFYSRVAAGADLKMIRAANGVVLWEGHHVAVSRGGTIPLDPVGVAMGAFDAASNLRDEQILRVTDDLTRRLVSTIPDNKVTALDDPASEPVKSLSQPVSTDDVQAGEALLASGDHAGALAAADRALAADPHRAVAWFLKGRVLMLDRNFAEAEPAILKAVALDPGNAKFLNALGALNAANGATERALAAYRMAIDADPTDGFAWYNSAVIHFNVGDPTEAADAFYGAGLAYLKTDDYAKAERALSDLRDLAKSGIPVRTQVKTIEDALTNSTRRKT